MKTKKKITDKSTDKRLLNLRPPWKKGETGNPKGRAKGPSLTTMMRELMTTRNRDVKFARKLARKIGMSEDATIGDLVVRMTCLHGIKGNASVLRDLWERLEGRAKEHMDVAVTVKDGGSTSSYVRKLIEKRKKKPEPPQEEGGAA